MTGWEAIHLLKTSTHLYLKPQLTLQQNDIVIRIGITMFTNEIQVEAVAEFPLDAQAVAVAVVAQGHCGICEQLGVRVEIIC